MKKIRLLNFLQTLAILVMTALISVSCSKSDDKDDTGGGVKPDPDIPTLSEITYDLSQNAVIMPEAVTKQLSNVDTLGHKLSLPTSAGKPEVGQCLIFNTPTKQLPDGLLAKVKEVKETSSGYDIVYQEAQLKDAFKNIDIPEQYIPLGQYVEHVYDAKGNEVKFSRAEKTRASGVKSFEIVLPEIGWEIDKGIELTPKMSIDLLMRYVFIFGDYELSYCGVKFDADITVGADLNCELKGSKLFEKKVHLLTVVCGAIPIGPVLLTPSIDVQGLVKADGKITLEASISYERTLHVGMIYQKGAGMKPSYELDPEEPDALKFTFGPKFEGGISYGLIMGGNIGIFGKTLAVRSRLNIVKKETISGKLDLAALTGTAKDWLTPYDIQLMPQSVLSNAQRLLEYAKKWNFLQFEDLMYNQAIGIQVGWDLTTIGVDVASTSLPEMSIPISSVHITPQVKIDEKDFMTFEGNDLTLLLHHPEQSVLDDLTEFRAEFKRVNAKPGETPISKYFNFDDDARNWLKAEVKGKDVTTTAKVTLNGEDDYDITVYMNVLGLEIPIFEAKAKKEDEFSPNTDIKKVTFNYYCYYTTKEDGKTYENKYFDDVDFPAESLSISKSGNSLNISGSLKKPYSTYGIQGEYNYTISFDANYNSKGLVEIKNIKVTRDQKITDGITKGTTSSYTITAADMPLKYYSTSRATWGGQESSTGQLIKSWDYTSHQYYDGKDNGTSSYSYEKNDKNSINVYMYWNE